jgi:hypothetical protein
LTYDATQWRHHWLWLAHVNFNHLKFVQHGFAWLSAEPLGSKGKNKGGSSILIQVKQRASAASDPAPTRSAA